ncbi:BT_3928 family protein [Emticicia sp. BO119]|uniref:BT_3928 family protein n=1 Tax=Emticicia sp. BO119 TaxID=2757768 RepID=UPI0015F0C420|nr:BT_3928 family protein [Emticicia sp. BO119]MBA4849798.1 DoxX family protein [Emticicia sp. BO119]
MKLISQIARIIVGVIFIFSGFVKVVDPVGTGIKLEEYFEVFSQDIPDLESFFMFFAHNSLVLSLIFCALEVILGVATLLSYRMKITSWLLLGIIVFFTFLTFYSAYFNKVTDCGCFGDFLKLKPWTSFNKDIFLTVLILIIFIFRNTYKDSNLHAVMAIATLISFGIGIYAILYLPPIDFLPYAIGKSIPDQMKPTGIKPIFEYTFLNKKTGKEEKSNEFLMDTTTYKYVSSITLNDDKVKPKITDYFVNDSQGNVYTDSTFTGNKLLFIFKKIKDVDKDEISEIKALGKSVEGTNIEPMILTSAIQSEFEEFRVANNLTTPYFTADATVLKTMARTNPCVILLQNGVVKGKWGNHSIPDKATIADKLK